MYPLQTMQPVHQRGMILEKEGVEVVTEWEGEVANQIHLNQPINQLLLVINTCSELISIKLHPADLENAEKSPQLILRC